LDTEESVGVLGFVAGGGRTVLWLDPAMKDLGAASEPLKPDDARLMRCYPVSTRVNHVASDGDACSNSGELGGVQSSCSGPVESGGISPVTLECG
jgi:hypothetical protein